MKREQIKKVHRLPDIVLSTGILALGLVLIFFVPSWSWLGITMLTIAVFMLPFYRTGYVIKSRKGVFLKKEILLPHECKTQIADYIEGDTDSLDINPFTNGGLLLEWYYKKDRSQQFGQLFDYEGGFYTAQSKLSELDDGHIRALLKYQANSKL